MTEILDSTNTLKEHIAYSSFGVPLQILDSNRSPASSAQYKFIYGYTGREIDRESGLYYYRARYYDPTIGRFLQKDPHPGKTKIPSSIANSYVYALNNATNLSDPTGKIVWFLAIPLAATLAGAISGGVWALVTGKPFFEGVLKGALGGLIGGAGAVAGLAIAGWIAGVSAATLIGTTAGTISAGIGSMVFSGAYGMLENPENPVLGGLVGAVFGFVGGAIAGAGKLPFLTDVSSGSIISGPPIPALEWWHPRSYFPAFGSDVPLICGPGGCNNPQVPNVVPLQ